MGVYEADKYAEWEILRMGQGDQFPMHAIDFDTASAFIAWLSEKENLPYRLATEAEWEYAARARTETRWWWGSDYNEYMVAVHLGYGKDFSMGPVATWPWPALVPPGSLPANPAGIYEVYGNAGEWVLDWYDGEFYKRSPRIDPIQTSVSNLRLQRGGRVGSLSIAPYSSIGRSPYPAAGQGGIRLCLPVDASFKLPETCVKLSKPPADPQCGTDIDLIAPDRLLHWPGAEPIVLRPIAPGHYVMGTPADAQEKLGARYEDPPTSVRFSNSYLFATTEITQQQFAAMMHYNPSVRVGPELPVHNVSFEESQEFCELLTARLRSSGQLTQDELVTLPTETQWEYACRAGTASPFSFGVEDPSGEHAVMDHVDGPIAVGNTIPNAWGFFDMHGNVAEWTRD